MSVSEGGDQGAAAAVGARVLGFLGVSAGERRSVARMTAHSFFMGCATVFFETAASATFLARFESRFIPWVYLAAALANVVTGSIYTWVQKRASFGALMKGTLWFLLALVVAVRCGFAVSSLAEVAFGGLVAYRIVSSLTDLEYWAVASRIYDVRQAKRLFGLVGTGEVVARIAGSFLVPLLVRVGGVSNLMVLSAGALLACLWLLGGVLRGAERTSVPPRGARVAPRPSLRQGLLEIIASPYLFVVVAVAVLATFGKYFVDFAFLAQVSALSKGEVELASLLGLFNGLTQTLSLLTRLFVSRPLLARLGIRIGVLILPVAHALCTMLVIAVGLLAPGPAVVWLVIANQAIYKTLKHPIDNASFKVLYQPLRTDQRLAVQIAVEIIFSPAVVGIAGVVMLLFSSGMRYDPVRFAFVLLAVFVAWVLAARAAGRGYARKLVEMLRRRVEGDFAIAFDDATTLSVLRSRAASEDPAEACAALRLLERAAPPDLRDTLLAQTSHADPSVRRYAIERLLELDPASLYRIHHRIAADSVASVRGMAMQVVARSGDGAVRELVPYLGSSDPAMRRAAFTVLLGLDDERARLAGHSALERLTSSAQPSERALAASLVTAPRHVDLVNRLLDDPDFAVRRAAILAAGQHRDVTSRRMLMELLMVPRFAQAAAIALAASGDAVLKPLDRMFVAGTDPRVLRRIVYVHSLVGSPAACAALSRRLDFQEVTVRSRVLGALDRLGWRAPPSDVARVAACLRDEARDAAWMLCVRRDLEHAPEREVVRDALESDRVSARARILQLLSFVHDRVAVRRAVLHLADASKDKRAFAREVLDVTLDAEERALLLPFIVEAPLAERLQALEGQVDTRARGPDERLRELADRAPARVRQWTQEVARWSLREPLTSEENTVLPIEKILALKSVPMFAATSEELVAEIASIVESVVVPEGTVIFEKGDQGESMYIVVRGAVRVQDGDITLRVLGEREIFGELALLDPKPRSASVIAAEETELFRIDADLFAQLMAANVDIVRGVLHVLCERLRATSEIARRRP